MRYIFHGDIMKEGFVSKLGKMNCYDKDLFTYLLEH